MARILLGSYTALGNGQKIPMSALIAKDPTGIQYLDKVELDVAISAVTQGAGGACSPQAFHQFLTALSVTDGKKPWGPVQLTGQQTDLARYFATGRPLPFARNVNGDANVALSTGPVTRQFKIVYDYSAYGKRGTYSPPCAAMANGQLSCSFATPTVNTTTFTFVVTAYAVSHGESKLRAVPRINTVANGLNTKNYNLGISGMLLQHFLESPVTAIAAADITNLTLTGADGSQILVQADVFAERSEVYWANPEIASANLLRNFGDTIGGTNAFGAPVYPLIPQEYTGVGDCPVSSAFNAIVVGAMNTQNYNACSTFTEQLDDNFADAQFVALGAKSGAVAGSRHDTASGKPLHNTKLSGHLPRVLTDASFVK